MTTRVAAELGVDISTSELALAVRDAAGNQGYVSTPMRGATCWQNDAAFPGFDLQQLPAMFAELLERLEADGWKFDTSGMVSVSCRQHDMVLLDANGQMLLPALSWQCNAATKEVAWLREQGVEQHVGPIAERFVLPKLRCVLQRDASLASRIGTVFLTGDWLAWSLTGARTLSSSDAVSNGLLTQQTRRKADQAFAAAGFSSEWFPTVARSGEVVGTVQSPSATDRTWHAIKQRLQGWSFVAGLGDNHASAVGCGMTDDYRTMVVSAGTSGTINFACSRDTASSPSGKSLRFEFYDRGTLLLQMLADCADWYNRFLAQLPAADRSSHENLNRLASSSPLTAVRRVLHDDRRHTEEFPGNWDSMPLGEQVASTQFSIMLELLLRVRDMLGELPPSSVATFVLTGGISQSEFFQQVFRAGIEILAPGADVKLSDRKGPLRYKTSAYGAMVNASMPQHGGKLSNIHAMPGQFPLRECAVAGPAVGKQIKYLLRSYGIESAIQP